MRAESPLLTRISLWPFLVLAPIEVAFSWVWITAEPILPRSDIARGVLTSFFLGTCLSLAIAWVIRRWLRTPRSWVTWILEYGIASVFGSAATMGFLFAAGLTPNRSIVIMSLFGLARWVNIVAIAYVVDILVREWRQASSSRAELTRILARVSRVNGLLVAAKDALFSYQANLIRQRVGAPLNALAQSTASKSNTELADDVDELISGTMRPLAHRMHPVTLSVGLVPALTALGSNFEVTADEAVMALDSQDELVDPDVRLQVYRWIRSRESRDSTISVTLSVRQRDLLVTVRGSRPGASIDPMMAVAGIRSLAPGETVQILAPLKGQFVDQLIAGDEVMPHHVVTEKSHRFGWSDGADVLTRDTGQWAIIAALLAIASLPFMIALNGLTLIPAEIIPILGWSVTPVVIAALVSRIPINRGTNIAAVVVVCSWIVVGLSAGLAESLFSTVFDQGSGAGVNPPLGFNLVRGVIRFTVPGLILFGARGLSKRAQSDRDRLQFEVEAALTERSRLLSESDRLERFIAERLHRSIQGRLSAISLLLRLGRRSEALSELDILRQVTVPALASRLQSAWKPRTAGFLDRAEIPAALSVTESVRANVLSELRPDQVADIRRFAAECAVNAQRHGGATSFTVSLIADSGHGLLTCTNDGAAIPTDASPGLGSALFDEVAAHLSGSWRFLPSAEGAVVQLRFPVLATGTSMTHDASESVIV